jgi:hypothetical protein
MAKRQVKVPARFEVLATSRHPRLGIDYNPVTHAFTDTYLNPRDYAITVDDFPGKTLFKDGSEPDQQRPGTTHPHRSPDIYKLDCPADTTGWQFRLTGQPTRRLPVGPPPPKITAHGATNLLTTTGGFDEGREDNAWNWRFTVPGPGTYTVTVNRMSGATVNKTGTATLTIEDYLVVSIGDSFASGEGNPDVPGSPKGFDPDLGWWDVFFPPLALFHLSEAAYEWGKEQVAENLPQLARAGKVSIDMEPEPVWLEREGHRSLRSGHAYAAQLLEGLQQGVLVTFLPFARSHSEIQNGLIGPRIDDHTQIDGWIGDIGQIDELLHTIGARRINALLISIGANDIGAVNTLKNLVAGDAPVLGQNDATQARHDAEAAALAKLAALPAKFDDLAAALTVLNIGQIYLTEYPTTMFDDVNGNPAHGCEVFSGPQLNLSIRDADLVKSLASQLNNALADAAAKHHWIYINGIDQRFHGRGYCTPDGERYFVQCVESLLMQGDTEGTIHPNDLGHKAIGEAVAIHVREHTIDAPQLGGGVAALAGSGRTARSSVRTRPEGPPKGRSVSGASAQRRR